MKRILDVVDLCKQKKFARGGLVWEAEPGEGLCLCWSLNADSGRCVGSVSTVSSSRVFLKM